MKNLPCKFTFLQVRRAGCISRTKTTGKQLWLRSKLEKGIKAKKERRQLRYNHNTCVVNTCFTQKSIEYVMRLKCGQTKTHAGLFARLGLSQYQKEKSPKNNCAGGINPLSLNGSNNGQSGPQESYETLTVKCLGFDRYILQGKKKLQNMGFVWHMKW